MRTIVGACLLFAITLVGCGASSPSADTPASQVIVDERRILANGHGAEIHEIRLADGTPCLVALSMVYGGIAISCDWHR